MGEWGGVVHCFSGGKREWERGGGSCNGGFGGVERGGDERLEIEGEMGTVGGLEGVKCDGVEGKYFALYLGIIPRC